MEGPYRFIRHPMYTSVLLGAGALISTNNNLDMLVAWIALFFVLWSKLGYEEKLLLQRFASYRSYQRRTGRLLPFF
jgi:protein-S-isoprenylcysteine O-methyltransferase Ste14